MYVWHLTYILSPTPSVPTALSTARPGKGLLPAAALPAIPWGGLTPDSRGARSLYTGSSQLLTASVHLLYCTGSLCPR